MALPAAVLGLLVFGAGKAATAAGGADQTAVQAVSVVPAEQIAGAWTLFKPAPESGEMPAWARALKFRAGRHWSVTGYDSRTGAILYHHGGTYAIKGGEYAETVEYANPNTTNLIGQTFRFTLKLEGETLTQVGIGNPWTEVWSRAK